ncbi:spindle assembly abnormal protein 6 homolog isoform X1 [Schistocerca americana]|uniref:spindle assembly abnormal protein 6 homolog isoform X1 n=2 Tax=Schistocerca americana TaxID=7009 RepID=UPI001F4F964E|nr:spindle assembly abnormal protein 6 homolog isoform X1 [Schistocerca americana]
MEPDRVPKLRVDSDMFMNSDPGFETVFSEQLAVSVVEETSEYKIYCNLKVEVNKNQPPPKEKVIAVKIVGISNPFFVYKGIMTAADYENIKTEHCLFVDFTKFIEVFLNLLRQCLHSDQGSTLRYVLRIEENIMYEKRETLLKIIEINDLRQMTHLYIKIQKCSEDEVKKIVTDRINLLQEERRKFMLKMEDYDSKILQFEAEIILQKAKTDEIIHEYEKKMSQISENHAKDLAAERERTQHLLAEREKQYQGELNVKDEEMQTKKIYWERQVNEGSALLTKAHAQIGLLAVHEKSLRKSLEERESEVSELKRVNSQLVNDIDTVKGHMERKETELRKIALNYKEVLQDFMDVSSRTADQERRLSKLEKENEVMRQKIDKYKKEQVDKMDTIEALKKQLSTAKNHLTEGKQKYISLVDKCEKAAELMSSQEKALEDMKKLLSDYQKEKEDIVKENKSLTATVKELRETIESMKMELTEKDNNLKSSESVISYLTKQVKNTKLSDPNTGLHMTSSAALKQSRLPLSHQHSYVPTPSSSDILSLGSLSISGATGYLHQQQQQLSAQAPPVPHIASITTSSSTQPSAIGSAAAATAAAVTASSYFSKKKSDST